MSGSRDNVMMYSVQQSFTNLCSSYTARLTVEERLHLQAHANFAELVPFTMFLFGLCELDGALPGPVLHAIGLVLFFSRLLHYYGTGLEGTPTNCRVFGTVGCVSSLSILGLSLIRYGLLHH